MLFIVCGVIPTQAQIHSRNDINVPVCLGPSSLLRHNLNAIISSFGNHALVAGKHRHIFVRQVGLNHVRNLTMSALGIVKNNLRLNDARRKLIVVFGDDFVVAIARQINFDAL